MKLIGLFCINLLVVNFIVALSLSDNSESKVGRILTLNYEDKKFQVVSKLGNPITKNSQKWHYRYNTLDTVIIGWQEEQLSFARADFSQPIPLAHFNVANKFTLLESQKDWAKVGIPEKGHQFELNAYGEVLSLEIRKPWVANGKRYYITSLLMELGLVPKMVMRESHN